MLYLRQLALPGGSAESNFFWSKEELKRTCYTNFYPFQIFRERSSPPSPSSR